MGVLVTSAMGDALLAVPMLMNLRAQRPDWRLTALVSRPSTLAFVRELHLGGAYPVDDVVSLPVPDNKSIRSAIAIGRNLREHSLDYLVQTYSSHGRFADIVCLFSGTKQRVGFNTSCLSRFALNARPLVNPTNGIHRVTLNLELLRALGISTEFGATQYVTTGSMRSAHGPGEQYVVLSVFADRNLPGKRWPNRNWIRLGQMIAEQGYRIVLTGASVDREEANELADQIGSNVTSVAGELGILQLAELMKGADAIVGTDGMPLHLADALGLAVLGLFGPTDQAECGPFNARRNGSVIVRAIGEPIHDNSTRSRDIFGAGTSQMETIRVEDVFGVVMRMLVHRN